MGSRRRILSERKDGEKRAGVQYARARALEEGEARD